MTRRVTAVLLGVIVSMSGVAASASSAHARGATPKACTHVWKQFPNGVMELFAGREFSYWELRQLMKDPCARRA